MRLGIMPHHCSADSPPLCDAMRRGQQPPCGTVPPTPVRLAPRALEKGQWNPRRDNTQLLCTCVGRRRDVRPVGAVTSVAIGPVRPSRPLHHHTQCCGTCGDRTPPRHPLYLVRPPVNDTLEPTRGRRPDERPLCRHPRSHSYTGTGRAMTPHQKRDLPGQPSTPWHYTPCLYS
jgi:hypothetical protein